MSSILISQGMVFATAMAVSGTVFLLAFRRTKSTDHQFITINQNSDSRTPQNLRSCLSLDGNRREKKKKRVHFADDVVDHPTRNGDDFRRECRQSMRPNYQDCGFENRNKQTMPENRMALYNGILRDRIQRTTCSY
ncbi:hypothetical protein IFM89_021387 [Coptis chinensis]|uniref:Uncharacterized protein n=1 Tax=Coptis chinensis TaxID=261450 RepID=A0A835IE26_9MAGN|nr:hypothetical protein IFM89_021387 [Coptis chinensis]